MTDEEFEQLIAQGHETGGVEFKGSCDLGDTPFRARIVRAILGLANRRGGGVVIVGVSENPDKSLNPTGLLPEHEGGWDHDRLSGIVSGYSDPSIELAIERRTYNGRAFQVIVVQEFPEVPILCKKPYSAPGAGGAPAIEILRQGACYVRSHRKPETSEVGTQEDMRALILLATEKAVRRFVELARTSELLAARSESVAPSTSIYDRELEGLL